MPKDFPPKINKRDHETRNTDNLLSIQFFDKRPVHILSSIHENKIENSDKIDRATGQPIKKHTAIIEYTKKMGTVDKSNMQINSLECDRKSMKWYIKFFMHLIDIS